VLGAKSIDQALATKEQNIKLDTLKLDVTGSTPVARANLLFV